MKANANSVKYVPSWFPGAGFKRTAQEYRKNLEDVAKKPYGLVQQRIKDGKYKPSFLSDILKLNGIPSAGSEEELVARWTTASLYGAGADTVCHSPASYCLKPLLTSGIDCVLNWNVLPRHGIVSRSST
jgi:hypothetical protein